MVTVEEVEAVLADRPYKLSAKDVGYQVAPEGSAMRCAACHHLYRRATDGFGVCELFRDDATDAEGIDPGFRCYFWSADGTVRPLIEEEQETKPY
jgi:hypothetical protein